MPYRMSTRSIVAAQTEKGLVGVYVHFDGYPEGRLPVLEALIKRDGVETVVATLLEGQDWSSLDNEPEPPGEFDGGKTFVPGYGLCYSSKYGSDRSPYWTPDQGYDWMGTEYIYFIHPDGSITWKSL